MEAAWGIVESYGTLWGHVGVIWSSVKSCRVLSDTTQSRGALRGSAGGNVESHEAVWGMVGSCGIL